EKVPFFALTGALSFITFQVQNHSHAVVMGFPMALRINNAIASYVKYLAKTFWPTHLAIFYPHPDLRHFVPPSELRYPASEQWPQWLLICSALFLVSISIAALFRLKRQPWFAVGWFWFVGMLVTVIGLVQVGNQAMADRYTY